MCLIEVAHISACADVGNAELSNAFATTAWELCVMSKSYHPELARGGAEVRLHSLMGDDVIL